MQVLLKLREALGGDFPCLCLRARAGRQTQKRLRARLAACEVAVGMIKAVKERATAEEAEQLLSQPGAIFQTVAVCSMVTPMAKAGCINDWTSWARADRSLHNLVLLVGDGNTGRVRART